MMTTINPNNTDKIDKWVITFPARISEIDGQGASFLLSTRQVIVILDTVPIWPLPIRSSTDDEIGLWNDEFLPVVNLEMHLGFENKDVAEGQRILVVQAPSRNPNYDSNLKALIRVDRQMQNMPLPDECKPLSSISWIPDTRAVRGVYRWNRQHLIVMDLEKILNGYHTAAA